MIFNWALRLPYHLGFLGLAGLLVSWTGPLAWAGTHTISVRHGTAGQHDPGFNIGKSLRPLADSTEEIRSWKGLKAQFNKLTQSSLKPGDQVVIIIDTHGLPTYGSEKTHAISLSDEIVSLDQLTPYLQKLAAAGVKVALVDNSCYSAPTLSLSDASPELNKNLCVVSGDSVNLSSSATFSKQLDSSFSEGASIEEWFLSARKNNTFSPSAPAISTDAGRACNARLADLNRIMGMALFWHYESVMNLKRSQPCQTPDQHPVLQKLVADMAPIIAGLDEQDADIQLIFQNLQEMAERIQSLSRKHPALIDQMKATRRLSDGKELTWIEADEMMNSAESWASLWSSQIIRKITSELRDAPPNLVVELLNQLDDYTPNQYQKLSKQVPQLAGLLKKEEANFRRYHEIHKFRDEAQPAALKPISSDEKDLLDAAGVKNRFFLALPERQLFDRCYKTHLEKHPPSEPNACQKIRLGKNW